jgi:hypothetical protein
MIGRTVVDLAGKDRDHQAMMVLPESLVMIERLNSGATKADDTFDVILLHDNGSFHFRGITCEKVKPTDIVPEFGLPRWTDSDIVSARSQGWCISFYRSDLEFRLEKHDVDPRFAHDEGVWRHVWAAALKDDETCLRALEFLRCRQPDEYHKLRKFLAWIATKQTDKAS